jgi:hypothetical protein
MEVESSVIRLDGIIIERLRGFGVLIEGFSEHRAGFDIVQVIIDFLDFVLTWGLLTFIVFVVKVVKVVAILKINFISIFVLVVEDDFFKRFLEVLVEFFDVLRA